MKIGIIYSGVYFGKESPNAAQRRIRDFARGLAYFQHQVTVIVPRYHNPEIRCIDTEYDVEAVGLQYSTPMIKGLQNKYSFWKETWHFIRQEIDILLFYNTRIDAISLMLKAKKSGKIVAAEFCDLRTYWNVNYLKNIPYWLDENIIPKLTTHNIAISETIKQELLKVASHIPVLKVPITVDHDTFKPTPVNHKLMGEKYHVKDDALKIGYTGTFYKKYGVRYLLEAFASLKNENPNLHLLLAGRDQFTENHDNIPALIDKFGLQESVTLTGWLNTDEVINVLSYCDIIVLPHTDDPLCVAGFPTKLGEYAAVGKAVVCTEVGEVSRFFTHEDDILFCEPNQSQAIVKAIERLIRDSDLRDRIGNNARKTAERHFSFLNVGQLISEFLTEEAIPVDMVES